MNFDTLAYAYIIGAFFTYILLLEAQSLATTDWEAPAIPSLMWPFIWATIGALALVYLYSKFLTLMETAMTYAFDLFEGRFK